MSLEYLSDPASGPGWRGLLPGRPEAYFLDRGEGEHAQLFTDLFTVLLSGDQTQGQAGLAHAYQVEEPTRMLGVATGGVRAFLPADGPAHRSRRASRRSSRTSRGCRQPPGRMACGC